MFDISLLYPFSTNVPLTYVPLKGCGSGKLVENG